MSDTCPYCGADGEYVAWDLCTGACGRFALPAWEDDEDEEDPEEGE